MEKSARNKSASALAELIIRASEGMILSKVIFSRPKDKALKKGVMTLREIGAEYVLQYEIFTIDNKAKHENIKLCGAQGRILEIIEDYSQINLICSGGECEYRASKSGNSVLIGKNKIDELLSISPESVQKIIPMGNNNRKKHILSGGEDFLVHLGISDKNGRVYDKKQAKFRQINRFLELVRDIEGRLPSTGTLRICDLCCGKSYLSFAVYYYFARILGREVKMTGIDLKADVIEYCSDVAERLGYDGLEFIAGDINLYDSAEHVDLVVSLHACDIATDIVLEKALHWQADVILSTPCCHHYLNHNLDCPTLSFIAEHSMLRQKLCDAATDALRLKRLEMNGYEVCSLELIDPDETPKNIMLRAIRRPSFDCNSREARLAREEYLAAKKFLLGEGAEHGAVWQD